MLHILLHDGSIEGFDDAGVLFKATTMCPCDTCDVACEVCAPEADCPHDSEGHMGGMCVSAPYTPPGDSLRWRRMKYYSSYRSHIDCSCTSQCAHVADLIPEQQRYLRGQRPKGVRREQFLATHKQEERQELEDLALGNDALARQQEHLQKQEQGRGYFTEKPTKPQHQPN